MTAGYDVEESATRLSSYLHVLRELAHLSCAHLPLEPRFEVKALLGDHLHDDALAAAELDAMTIRTSQFNPHQAIPEKNLLYRLAKRFWFNDFGAYRGMDHTRESAPARLHPAPV